MPGYYMNKNAPPTLKDHEVHTESCTWLPDASNRIYLGYFTTCREAVAAAKKHYADSNGCYYCSKDCHTT